MLSREKIYRRLSELHEEIEELKYLYEITPINEPCRNRIWFNRETDRLRWCINRRKDEIKELEKLLIRDLNTKTLHLSVVYEEELDYDDIVRNGIRGVRL